MAVSVGHVTPRQTSEREFGAPPRAAAANYARSDAHATPTIPNTRFARWRDSVTLRPSLVDIPLFFYYYYCKRTKLVRVSSNAIPRTLRYRVQ